MRRRTTRGISSRATDDEGLPVLRSLSESNNPRSTVIYGIPGSGKTTLAATWPKPILFLDMNDRGTDSIVDVKDGDFMQIVNPGEIDKVYWWLKEGQKYKTTVLDTTTRMQQLYIEKVTGDRDAGRWGSMKKSDWGDVAAEMKSQITNYRDLPMNIIFLAQQRMFNIDEDESLQEGLMPEIGPALMPSIATHLNASVAVICQTFIRERVTMKEIGRRKVRKSHMEYCLYVGPNPIRITKVRKPKSVVLPSYLVNPTYEDLIAMIEGE